VKSPRIWRETRDKAGQACRTACKWYRTFAAATVSNPVLLVPAFLLYVLASIATCVLSFLLFAGLYLITYRFWEFSADLTEALWQLTSYVLLAIIWGHYLFRNFYVFIKNFKISGDVLAIGRILQLLLTVVFVIAAAYYYLQLFSDNRALSGMHPTPQGKEHTNRDPSALELLVQPPPLESAVDCCYFSIVTITTLGYGDIEPQTVPAKILTSIEVLFGFVLIVVVLGSIIGRTVQTEGGDEAEPSAQQEPERDK